jgi:hypothetical protein
MLQVTSLDFMCPILAAFELRNARGIDVETHHGNAGPREGCGNRKANIPQSDNCDFSTV